MLPLPAMATAIAPGFPKRSAQRPANPGADGTGVKFELELVTTLANKDAIKASDFVFVI